MGRPAKFDRDEAVETVMNDIWKDGYEANSVKAISEKLGITRSSFYNAFHSRDDLFEEVLERYFAQSPDRVLSDVESDARVVPLLISLFQEVCRTRAADPDGRGCLVVNCVSELCGSNEKLGAQVADAVLTSVDRLERLLRQAAAHGEINDDGDLREKALALQNLLIGLNTMSKVVRSETDLWAVAQQTLKGLGLYTA